MDPVTYARECPLISTLQRRGCASQSWRACPRPYFLGYIESLQGAFTPTHSLRQLRLCAERRRLETTNPPAIKIHKTALAGHLLIEPLATYDKNAPDQYEVKWLQGFRQAYVDLLPVLQPRNMEVPKGFVTEVPVLADELGPNQHYLILFLNDAVTRELDEVMEQDEAEEQIAASKQQEQA